MRVVKPKKKRAAAAEVNIDEEEELKVNTVAEQIICKILLWGEMAAGKIEIKVQE